MAYIQFKKLLGSDTGKDEYIVETIKDKDKLGKITYYQGWKQYVFRPFIDTQYSYDCLLLISSFCKNLNRR